MSHPSFVKTLYFSVKSDEETERLSCGNVTHKEMFIKGNIPKEEGPYDPHFGTTDYSWDCSTCRNEKTVCPGHFGSLQLRYPVKNPLFVLTQLIKWLRIVCHSCGALLVNKKLNIEKEKILPKYVQLAANINSCPECKAPHYKVTRSKTALHVFEIDIGGRKEELFNHEIARILERITDETVLKVGKPLVSHPRHFIIHNIGIPPNTIRPDIRSLSGNRSNNSDITAFIKTLVEQNEQLPLTIPDERETIMAGGKQSIQNRYRTIDLMYYSMIKGSSTTSGNQVRATTSTNKPASSIASRHPKKSGRYRKNINGKRVWYIVRSVIVGDNFIRPDEIGIPKEKMAMVIDIPEVVTEENYERLNMYYQNGNKNYPGCHSIKKKSGGVFDMSVLKPDSYILQVGDIVNRHMINGDIIDFNRQPSLIFSSIACHRVIVLEGSSTIRMNVSACALYNADFDGDCMSAIIPRNIMTRVEIFNMTSVRNWMRSLKDSSPALGAFQDSLIGSAKLTETGVEFNKRHAMYMFGNITNINLLFDKKSYTGRELVSMLLSNTKINLKGKTPKIYLKEFANLLDYNPDDINIDIDRGVLKTGILDKSTVGQEVQNTIFHTIANEYGPQKAIDVIYNFHQIVSRFFLYRGFTVGVSDTKISDKAKERINLARQSMFQRSLQVTEKLDAGLLTHPIGTNLKDYYEDEQMNALQPADDFIRIILEDIDLKSNGMAQLILHGSKGKPSNLISINGDIGQPTIGGKRPERNFSWGRTSPYVTRYDTNPRALGYVATSYREGIQPDVYPFAAGEARHGIINNALSTSITGYQNILSVKSLESILVNNNRSSATPHALVQTLYAETGLDPRNTEKVKFPTVMISDKELEDGFKADVKQFASVFNNAKTKELLEEEFKQIKEDRELYREIFIGMSRDDPGGKVLMEPAKQMPVNIHRILNDAVYNYKDDLKEAGIKSILNPVSCIEKVKNLCQTIGYVYFNSKCEELKRAIPFHIEMAITLMKILIRSCLATKQLIKLGINDLLLDTILLKIKITFKKALMDYGMAAGVIAAECFSEPLTQYILNSKHRAGGGGGSKTETVDRVRELLGARDTKKMKNTSMTLIPLPEYEDNRAKVQEIANHIEMMNLERFIYTVRLFFEDYGNPIHEAYKHEVKMIHQYEKYNPAIEVPADLAKWCIRIELSREEMLINSMKLETIINVLNKKFPDIHIVYTPENSVRIILRIYIRHVMIKPSATQTSEEAVMGIIKKIRATVIRGVKGIQYASVFELQSPYITEDGSVKIKNIYGIETDGTNLKEIIDNPYLDPTRIQTDSVKEYEEMYGIGAARNKIINEMIRAMSGLNKVHASIYADQMTYTGTLTSIQKAGMNQREMGNVALRLGFQSPIQVSEDAAANGIVCDVHGISGGLITGAPVRIGTQYNKVIVSEKFIKENAKSVMENIDEEL